MFFGRVGKTSDNKTWAFALGLATTTQPMSTGMSMGNGGNSGSGDNSGNSGGRVSARFSDVFTGDVSFDEAPLEVAAAVAWSGEGAWSGEKREQMRTEERERESLCVCVCVCLCVSLCVCESSSYFLNDVYVA